MNVWEIIKEATTKLPDPNRNGALVFCIPIQVNKGIFTDRETAMLDLEIGTKEAIVTFHKTTLTERMGYIWLFHSIDFH